MLNYCTEVVSLLLFIYWKLVVIWALFFSGDNDFTSVDKTRLSGDCLFFGLLFLVPNLGNYTFDCF